MDEGFGISGARAAPAAAGDAPGAGLDGNADQPSVYDSSFPSRVAAFLRFTPVIDAVQGARRRDWPDHTYDIVTLTLTAIDYVVSRQGFEFEATRDDVVAALRELAEKAAPERGGDEHLDVAEFVVDALLNRAAAYGEFRYVASDYSSHDDGHRQREVAFSLLIAHDHPGRSENVLRATKDAVNALIGGLDFDVEDEQVATELMLERQLARNAFDSALKSAERARLLSVGLAAELEQVIKQTRRDIGGIEEQWAQAVPDKLDGARRHIRDRLNSERMLLGRAREALSSSEQRVRTPARRIVHLLDECRRRHEALHQRVIDARGVFLDEQARQSFRPPAAITLPDPCQDVLMPALELGCTAAETLAEHFLVALSGPRSPRLPRLYRVIDDLWSQQRATPVHGRVDEAIDLMDPPSPLIAPAAVEIAAQAVARVGLPARLSTLVTACLEHPSASTSSLRQQAAEALALAVLWAFSPEDADDDEGRIAEDLMARILGPRAAVDTDGIVLRLPGWSGDDVIVARTENELADAAPGPTTATARPPADVLTNDPSRGTV